jgi:AcrR family transcriptional regulator
MAMIAARKLAARKQPRQERSKDTVGSILRATARILTRDGYEGATTNRIAEVAGVSVGSLYQYFPNKDAIVAALIDAHCEEMFEVFRRELVAVAGAGLEVATRAVVAAQIEAHKLNPRLHRVFLEQLPKVGMLKRFHEINRRSELLVRTYLEARRDEMRPANLDLAAFLLVTTVEAVTHAAVIDQTERLDDPDFITEVTALCVRYLAKG